MRPALQETGPARPGVTRDRRTLRTRVALRDALAAEIQETGDLSKVTVTSVAGRSGLTRRTFYSHFRDIPDLVGQIEDETIADLRPLVRAVAASSLTELQESIGRLEPSPGSIELLEYFKAHGDHLAALLGEGGDPAFARRLEAMVREEVSGRATQGLDLGALGPLFDYYLTYAISAQVGVLVRWLSTGMREDVGVMARLMTSLAFIRPGDLYGKSLDFDVRKFGLALMFLKTEGENDR